VHREQRECALEAGDDGAEGGDEVVGCRELAPEQDGGDLGVGLAHEGVALREELVLQLGEVLDDAVVDDGELAVVGEVRVRVDVGRSAVRGPAGVTDAGRPVHHRVGAEVVAQHLELAGALAHLEVAVRVDHGDTGGVVTAVLEAGKTREEDGLTVTRPHVSDDSTHGLHARRGRLGLRRAAPHRARRRAQGLGGRGILWYP